MKNVKSAKKTAETAEKNGRLSIGDALFWPNNPLVIGKTFREQYVNATLAQDTLRQWFRGSKVCEEIVNEIYLAAPGQSLFIDKTGPSVYFRGGGSVICQIPNTIWVPFHDAKTFIAEICAHFHDEECSNEFGREYRKEIQVPFSLVEKFDRNEFECWGKLVRDQRNESRKAKVKASMREAIGWGLSKAELLELLNEI